MLPEGYVLKSEIPSVDDYVFLRDAVPGLTARSKIAAEAGLKNTCAGVTVFKDDKAVGMGRLIGDGALVFNICDMAVLPEHQGKGIGKAIMDDLMRRLREIAPAEAYVSLVADGDAKHLYAKYGFLPVYPWSIGMYQWHGR